MARKGFWNKLFGGGDPPEDRDEHAPGQPAEKPTPDPPEIPAQHEQPPPALEPEPRPDPEAGPGPEPDDPAQAGEPAPQPAEASGNETARDDPPGETPTDPTPPPPDSAPEDAPDPGDSPLSQTAELKTDAVGRVYAEALLDLARDAGEQDAIAQQVSDLLPLVEPGSDLHRLVTNPVISADERSKIIGRVFEGKVSDLLLRFLKVVADKDRLGSLGAILSGYLILTAESGGQVTVDAYVASPMDDAAAAHVAQRIGQSLGKEVALRQHVDETLIGGLKIKVGDKLIDASVASQLRAMKNRMIEGQRG